MLMAQQERPDRYWREGRFSVYRQGTKVRRKRYPYSWKPAYGCIGWWKTTYNEVARFSFIFKADKQEVHSYRPPSCHVTWSLCLEILYPVGHAKGPGRAISSHFSAAGPQSYYSPLLLGSHGILRCLQAGWTSYYGFGVYEQSRILFQSLISKRRSSYNTLHWPRKRRLLDRRAGNKNMAQVRPTDERSKGRKNQPQPNRVRRSVLVLPVWYLRGLRPTWRYNDSTIDPLSGLSYGPRRHCQYAYKTAILEGRREDLEGQQQDPMGYLPTVLRLGRSSDDGVLGRVSREALHSGWRILGDLRYDCASEGRTVLHGSQGTEDQQGGPRQDDRNGREEAGTEV